MAFQVFNFGKQLGIVGNSNPPSKSEPFVGNIEVDIVDTTIGGRGGSWVQGSPILINNPLNPGETELRPGGWSWNDGPDIGEIPGRAWRGGYRKEEDPKKDVYVPDYNEANKCKIKFYSVEGNLCDPSIRDKICKMMAGVPDLDCWKSFDNFDFKGKIKNLLNGNIAIACKTECDQQSSSHTVATTSIFEYDSTGKRIGRRPEPVIFLCPHFFAVSEYRQRNTLVHEIVHTLEGTEFDSILIEFMCSLGDYDYGDIPFPRYGADKKNNLWCYLKYGANLQKLGYTELPAQLIRSPRGQKEPFYSKLFLLGKFFAADLESGEVYLVDPATGLIIDSDVFGWINEGILPPLDWWYKSSPDDGCEDFLKSYR